MNCVQLMGRLTADPEIKQTQSGKAFVRFIVAVDRPVKQGAEKQADFINCLAWEKTAEVIGRYFRKGMRIIVEGSIRTGSYKDNRYPDVTHYTSDVWANRIEFCESKNAQNNAQGGAYGQAVPHGNNNTYQGYDAPYQSPITGSFSGGDNNTYQGYNAPTANTQAAYSGGFNPADFEVISDNEFDLPL